MNIPVTLPSGEVIEGEYPIVIIGPNGSGKTRASRNLNAEGGVEFINALRNTRINPQIAATTPTQAESNYNQVLNQSRSNHWEMSSEFDALLSKIYSDDAMIAMEYRDAHKNGQIPPQDETVLEKVRRVWSIVYPGRTIDFKNWTPTVKNEALGVPENYSGYGMSDGERVGLYLAARILSENKKVLIVDEPETHFHSRLAILFWDALESERPDVRFVYITHDLTFGLSRHNARFILAKPGLSLQVLSIDEKLPPDIVNLILGAASFSIYATRIIFCEGTETSIDAQFYRAWFIDRSTVVIPVVSCENVLQCVSAYRTSPLISGVEAIGIIDRDYRPDNFLNSIPEGIYVLPVHEVESLYCCRNVIDSVGKHFGNQDAANSFFSIARNQMSVHSIETLILDRWKQRLEPLLESLVSSVKAKEYTSIEKVEVKLPAIFDYNNWSFDPKTILKEEQLRVQSILKEESDENEFLKIIPGKNILAMVSQKLKFGKQNQYVEFVNTVLKSNSKDLELVKENLESALLPYLPDRHQQKT